MVEGYRNDIMIGFQKDPPRFNPVRWLAAVRVRECSKLTLLKVKCRPPGEFSPGGPQGSHSSTPSHGNGTHG